MGWTGRAYRRPLHQRRPARGTEPCPQLRFSTLPLLGLMSAGPPSTSSAWMSVAPEALAWTGRAALASRPSCLIGLEACVGAIGGVFRLSESAEPWSRLIKPNLRL